MNAADVLAERNLERARKVRGAIQVITNACNTYDGPEPVIEGIVEALNHEHRTLQQSFWRVMYEVMKKYGADDWCDLRNEASKEFCREVTEKIEAYFPHV